jgi:hypothetical protein
VPTSHEYLFEDRSGRRPTELEGAYGLGYRGVVPDAVAEKITRPPQPGQLAKKKDRRDELVWDVAAAIAAVGMRLTRTYAGALNERLGRPVEEGGNVLGQNVNEIPQIPGNGLQAPPGRTCRGRQCADRQRLDGVPPSPIGLREAAGEVCQQCRRRRAEDRERGLLNRSERLVGKLVSEPPEWEGVLRTLRRLFDRGVVHEGAARARMRAMGLRYEGPSGIVACDLTREVLQVGCECAEHTGNERCNTICGSCGGVRRDVEVWVPEPGDLCTKCRGGEGVRAKWGGCWETRHMGHRSKPVQEWVGCNLHPRQ